MPKGSALYSADIVQLVAQANRRIAQEAKRQEAGGAQATEAGAVALHYAQKELDHIYGYNSGVEKLSLKGETDPQKIADIVEAAKRITESKMLTVSGRKEARQKAMASFFGVDRGLITAKMSKIYKALTESAGGGNVFEKLRENPAGYAAGTIQNAIQQMVENDLTSDQITEAIQSYAEQVSRSAGQYTQSIYDYLEETYPDMEWG